jgi:hypothetical protein
MDTKLLDLEAQAAKAEKAVEDEKAAEAAAAAAAESAPAPAATVDVKADPAPAAAIAPNPEPRTVPAKAGSPVYQVVEGGPLKIAKPAGLEYTAPHMVAPGPGKDQAGNPVQAGDPLWVKPRERWKGFPSSLTLEAGHMLRLAADAGEDAVKLVASLVERGLVKLR